MIQYNFVPQIGPKPKIKGKGVLTIDKTEAVFWEGSSERDSKILGLLKNPSVKWISHLGILVTGFEPNGFDRVGNQKFIYREWYCSFINVL